MVIANEYREYNTTLNSTFEELEYIFYNDDEVTIPELIEMFDNTIMSMQEELKQLLKYRRSLG